MVSRQIGLHYNVIDSYKQKDPKELNPGGVLSITWSIHVIASLPNVDIKCLTVKLHTSTIYLIKVKDGTIILKSKLKS